MGLPMLDHRWFNKILDNGCHVVEHCGCDMGIPSSQQTWVAIIHPAPMGGNGYGLNERKQWNMLDNISQQVGAYQSCWLKMSFRMPELPHVTRYCFRISFAYVVWPKIGRFLQQMTIFTLYARQV